MGGVTSAIGSALTGDIGGALGSITGADDAADAMRDAAGQIQFNPFNVQSGLGAFNVDGQNLSTSLSPELQGISDQFGGQAGAFGQQLGQFDPQAFAQDRFGAFQSLVNPARQRARESLESRLLSQGRLGSTGGSRQQSAVEEGFAQQDIAGAEQALSMAFNRQAQLQGLQQGAFGGLLQAQTAPLSLANIGLTGGSGALQAAQGRAGLMSSAAQIVPTMTSNLISGAIQGGTSAFLGG